MREPVLRDDDLEAWDALQRAALVHARTTAHRRRVDAARRSIGLALEASSSAAVMWSGGKDSTCLTHLVCAELGYNVPVASEKDDLDYPGERAYVEDLGRAWGLDLVILEPAVSPRAWYAEHAREVYGEDVHGRAAEMSKKCFYEVVDGWSRGRDLIFLGLRAEESRARRMNRAVRGQLYRKASGQMVSTPIVDWRGLDVYAYAAARGIEFLPLYRCIAFDHAREPWTVRKSWWVPAGGADRKGGTAWLRRYYPSLFWQLVEWTEVARRDT